MNKRYEVVNTLVLADAYESISPKNEKFVISKFSAADIWGFSPFLPKGLSVTVPKGYNPSKKYEWFNFAHKVIEKYNEDIIEVEFEGRVFKVYSPEKAFVEIMREWSDEYNDQKLELIENFFRDIDYDKERLHILAKDYKVYSQVVAFESVYGKW